MYAKILEKLRCLQKEEDGGTTIEFVMWIPIMVMMLGMTTDATLLMHQQQNLYNMARDASRQVALGHKTMEEAAILLESRVPAKTKSVEVVEDNGYVTAKVSVPFSDSAKITGFFLSGSLRAEVSMWIEENDV